MAITITIGDGTDLVTLTATDGQLESWTPVTPGMDADSVTESLEVTLLGNQATMAANVAELERLFQGARERVGGAYGIAYTYLKVTLDSAVWRSPVLDGRVMTKNEQWIKGDWALGTREVTILVQREAWWEDDTERAIPLVNSNGSNNTAGLNVFNSQDYAGSSPNVRTNTVALSDLVGDLPAPVRISILNLSSTQIAEMFIAENVNSDPQNLKSMYEASLSGTVNADANYSGGSYESVTGVTSAAQYGTILAADMNRMKGGYYRIVARHGANRAIKITPYLFDGTNIFLGKKIAISGLSTNHKWSDLGVLQIPPRYVQGVGYNDIGVRWNIESDAAFDYAADAFQISALDGWKKIVPNVPIPQNQYLMVDEPMKAGYGLDNTSKLIAYCSATGDVLNVYPSKLHFFHFLWNGATTSAITLNINLKMFYRPRRRTL